MLWMQKNDRVNVIEFDNEFIYVVMLRENMQNIKKNVLNHYFLTRCILISPITR